MMLHQVLLSLSEVGRFTCGIDFVHLLSFPFSQRKCLTTLSCFACPKCDIAIDQMTHWNPEGPPRLLLILHSLILRCLEEVTPQEWSLNSLSKFHHQISSTVNHLPIFTFTFIFFSWSLSSYLVMNLKENCSVTFILISCRLKDQDLKTSETSVTHGNICLGLTLFSSFS